MIAYRPEFGPRTHVRSWVWWCTCEIPAPGRWRQEDLWGALVSQPGLINRPHTPGTDPASKYGKPIKQKPKMNDFWQMASEADLWPPNVHTFTHNIWDQRERSDMLFSAFLYYLMLLFVSLFCFCCCFWDKISLCSPVWLQTHAPLDFTIWVLGLQVCTMALAFECSDLTPSSPKSLLSLSAVSGTGGHLQFKNIKWKDSKINNS